MLDSTTMLYAGLIFGGLLAVAALGGLWIKTGRKLLLAAALLAAALTVFLVGGMILLDALTESDEEKIQFALHDIADAVENHDVNRVLSYVHSDAADMRERVHAMSRAVSIEQVDIAGEIEVNVNREVDPHEADTEFVVAVKLKPSGGDIERAYGDRPFRVRVHVRFRKDDEAWKVYDYSIDETAIK